MSPSFVGTGEGEGEGEGEAVHECRAACACCAEDMWSVFAMVRHAALCGDDSLDPSSSSAAHTTPVEVDDACGFCGSRNISLEDGNYVCADCNTLATRFIDHSAEWRYYGSDDNKAVNPSRCGPPVNDLLPSLGATLSSASATGRDSYGARMMQKYQVWNSLTYRERSLYCVFDTLTVNAANNGISTCILEEAKALYKRVSELKISRGDNRAALIACCIYMACKTNKVPRSLKEITEMFGVKTTAMTKSCKLLQQIMRTNVVSSCPDDFIARFCSRLGLAPELVAECKRIVHRADEMSIVSESTPPSIVASAIYMCDVMHDLGIGKKAIAEACQISQVTISKCYKKLVSHKDALTAGTR